jgi:hypothetical protein
MNLHFLGRPILFIAFVLFGFLSGCHESEQSPTPPIGEVAFSFKEASIPSGGRKNGENTPAFASYTLKGPDGVLVNRKIDLYLINDQYITQPQQMVTGSYSMEQFLVLNISNSILYATPLENSPLADLVENPLPLSFDVTAEGTSNVVPEVLEVAGQQASDFGFTTFGFEVVKTTAVKLPLPVETELQKIVYRFSNGNQLIESELIPGSVVVNFDRPELMGKTWTTELNVWIASADCGQRVYRYRGNVTFNGQVVLLPDMEQSQWRKLYYNEVQGVKIYRSMDPHADNYYLDLYFPNDIESGYVDLTFWNAADQQLCQSEVWDFVNPTHLELLFDDTCGNGTIAEADSAIILRKTGGATFQSLFTWKMQPDGKMVKKC